MRTRFLSYATIATALAIVLTCFAVTADAQFTISIPNFPKIKKDPKPTPAPPQEAPQENTNSNSNSNSNATQSNNDDEAPAKKSCADDSFYQVWNEEIQKAVKDAKSFTAGRDYFVQDASDDENRYLKMALSLSERKERESDWADDAIKKCVNDRLDELAAVASIAIQGYKPVGYTLGTPAEKNILRNGVTDLSQAAVFNVGLKSPNWIIVKDEYGLPRHRKRYGSIWAKYPNDKYCKIIYVNLFQDYAGGGTYNASEPQFINWEYAGCPPGK